MLGFFAIIDYVEPFLKLGASFIGVFSFSVYYYATKDIDWEQTDEAQ
tara:strand:+ start:1201 stop:1341 length:141 start_codon:yes stop_codon:yes gene_type:complete